MSTVIVGCGDVGRRIVKGLLKNGVRSADIAAFVSSQHSVGVCAQIGLSAVALDLDEIVSDNLNVCQSSQLYYTVPPPSDGVYDLRSRALLAHFRENQITPKKVVLISTTGVYGDCAGEWVTENSPTDPQTERGKRRLDLEQQWLAWGGQYDVPVVVLRVPGIYAYDRLPRERLRRATPVVKAEECGFTNRIHADDLAMVCRVAMERAKAGDVFNVTDGTPGKISEYLQAAARVLGLPPLPEISMQEAQGQLSAGMLSYLGESRKISNRKMLQELGVELTYPDYLEGICN